LRIPLGGPREGTWRIVLYLALFAHEVHFELARRQPLRPRVAVQLHLHLPLGGVRGKHHPWQTRLKRTRKIKRNMWASETGQVGWDLMDEKMSYRKIS